MLELILLLGISACLVRMSHGITQTQQGLTDLAAYREAANQILIKLEEESK